MRRIVPLFLLSLFVISACKATGESTLTITVTSEVTDQTVCFIIKDISIADESWPRNATSDTILRCEGSDEIDHSYALTTETEFKKTITCFSGDTICFGGASTSQSWGVGITGTRDGYDKDLFCTSCKTKNTEFTLTDNNSNDDELDDSDEDIIDTKTDNDI